MNDEDGATVVELADRLWRAEVDRTPIEPITETRPDLTIADAYAIQAYNVRGASRPDVRSGAAGSDGPRSPDRTYSASPSLTSAC